MIVPFGVRKKLDHFVAMFEFDFKLNFAHHFELHSEVHFELHLMLRLKLEKTHDFVDLFTVKSLEFRVKLSDFCSDIKNFSPHKNKTMNVEKIFSSIKMANTNRNKNLVPSRSYFQRVKDYVKTKWNEFVDWIDNSKFVSWFRDNIPLLKPRAIDTAFEHVKKTILKPFEIAESKSALKNFAIAYTIKGQDGYDERSFLSAVKSTVINLLKSHYEIKVKIILHSIMERYEVRSGAIITAKPAFHSDPMVNIKGSDTDDLYSEMSQVISRKISKFRRTGSVVKLEVHMVDYEPLKGNSYIELPKALLDKKAIINMQNKNDNECFKWAVTRALNPKDQHPERIKDIREKAEKLNWNGIQSPVSLPAIDKFEEQNETISVYVFEYEEERGIVSPLKRANVNAKT